MVSIDFELYWGVARQTSLEAYKASLPGARHIIPRLLELFGPYGVRATWATVGFLFFDEKTSCWRTYRR